VIIWPGMLKSAARSGVFGPYTTIRVPLRHTVCRRLVPGSGPRSRSTTRGATASGTLAAISVRRSSGRLTKPLASAPSVNVLVNASRSGSPEASTWRSSTCSTSGMMLRTQMVAPTPTARKATDMDRPRARLDRSVASTEPTSRPT
jgi:hypothetical protein